MNTYIYKINQYLSIMKVTNAEVNITEECNIMFASSFLFDTAEIWWLTSVQNNATPTTWEDLKQALLGELLLEDHIRCARVRLKRAKQSEPAAKYISEYCNIISVLLELSERKTFDRFIDGSKRNIRLEFMKTTINTLKKQPEEH